MDIDTDDMDEIQTIEDGLRYIRYLAQGVPPTEEEMKEFPIMNRSRIK